MDRFEVYKEAELTRYLTGCTWQGRKRKEWRSLLGFDLSCCPRVLGRWTHTPFNVLYCAINLTIWHWGSRPHGQLPQPCLWPPSFTHPAFQSRMFPVCRLLFSHTYKALPLLSSVSKFHASITGYKTYPSDSSSSPKRKDQGAAPLHLPIPLPCSASICILGASIHNSRLWPKYKNHGIDCISFIFIPSHSQPFQNLLDFLRLCRHWNFY